MQRISRRRLLAASGGAILASTFFSRGIASAQQQPSPPSPWDRRWDIALDMQGWQAIRERGSGDALPAGPFEVAGRIYPVATLRGDGTVPSGVDDVGTARAFGWIYDSRRGRGIGNLVLQIDDEGEVALSGVLEGARQESMSVVGGTERFRGASGEATVLWYNQPMGLFRVTLHIATP